MLAQRRERELSAESTSGFGYGSGQKELTYVFRGVRQHVPNPLYSRPLTTQASQLPFSSPDYFPPPSATPLLLFSTDQSKAGTLASFDRQGAAGKLCEWVGNVQLPQAGLGPGLELEEVAMYVDVDEEAGEVGRVVGMMQLVGR
ncbi:hypothetical protein CALVIDRAFT_543379 [Calocera viscosa TUFC12733]|uniref:Uncharacterized protein n=1 Tax=Calocera viscosa (strain TUFC12733) TaxID=1330018 RepID=A0A167FN67_CALVF|nr:hypothetical protein CALVIDRAFT_543379 [Calocera viscosa TUFC12733]